MSSSEHKCPLLHLPTEICFLIIEQFSFETLVNFRHVCRRFFYLTDDLKPLEKQEKKGIKVEYPSKRSLLDFISFRSEKVISLNDVPKSRFWIGAITLSLQVKKVTAKDKDKFLVLLKQCYSNIIHIHIHEIPVDIVEEIIKMLEKTECSIELCGYVFFTDEFHMLNNLKAFNPITVYFPPRPKRDEWWIDKRLKAPVEGMNNMIKGLIDGDYRLNMSFINLINQEPINLSEVFKDIEYRIYSDRISNREDLNIIKPDPTIEYGDSLSLFAVDIPLKHRREHITIWFYDAHIRISIS